MVSVTCTIHFFSQVRFFLLALLLVLQQIEYAFLHLQTLEKEFSLMESPKQEPAGMAEQKNGVIL
ncbi:hypothetical protein PanWU01x14_051440 [Parasponia andersonii]|uniref:Uncharacterized protein n=1 Tax=Parasponia andersonii TaxID=3476 RepID=A0A2P5DLY9_PARAD|nr:hypothetical protein PanWU01x14_051440 [Parasponia andersonii]